MPRVQIEGLGTVDFPEGTSPEDMERLSNNALMEKNTGHPATGLPEGTSTPDPITGNHELTNQISLREGFKGVGKGVLGSINGMNSMSPLEAFSRDSRPLIHTNTASSNPDQTAGKIAEGIGEFAIPMMGESAKAASAIKDFAAPEADLAAMKGLRVAAGSKNAKPLLGKVETAKPYLQGSNSLEDLQSRIPGAKTEVYKPYEDFVNANRHASLGDSTVGDLFDRDKEITAQLGNLKNDPLAVQQAAQKGLTQADLLAEQKAIRSKLFPAAEESGVKASEINKTYGALKGIEKQVAGKNTIAVSDEPMGFGRMRNLSIKQPLKALDEIKPAMQDIINGRYWSGNPVDTAIQDAFKTAGPKPDLGQYRPLPRLQLPAQASPEVIGSTDLAVPHGEVFPKVVPSRLKRADLY